ncbi:MAG: hypothetical protein WB689_15815 [Xanthobacteraceae bacterium]
MPRRPSLLRLASRAAPETVGDVVPEDIKLYPVPQDVIQKVPQARSHMFFVKDDEVILFK